MASARAKTTLACDRCRRRKSRCDGKRPSCSHCVAARLECSYRPTPTNLETDVSVLSRLADAESRIRALEAQCATNITSSSSSANGHHISAPTRDETLALALPPVLHTASAHQMLHSWPRIRLCLTLPGFNYLGFLADADEAEPFLPETSSHHVVAPRLGAWQVLEAIERFYGEAHKLPVALAALLDLYDDFHRSKVLEGLLASDHDAVIEPSSLSIAQLLVLSMALKSQHDVKGDLADAALAYFSIVMSRQWTLLTAKMDRVVLSLVITHCLVHYWLRPFHALGLLQSLGPTLKRMSMRCPDDRLLYHCSLLYFILEGDIITELDEYSIETTLSGDDSAAIEALSNLVSSTAHVEDQATASTITTYVRDHAWLRSHLNKTLHLYSPNMAYARPHELAHVVARLSSELHQWYQRQPMDRQFARDLTTFSLNRQIPFRSKELAIRYLSCVFLIHRPVLYFLLHKDMEYSIQSPNETGAASDHQPWVMESCRDCIESAALIILLCTTLSDDHADTHHRMWFEYQLLFASHLTILQARSLALFTPIFRNIGDVEALLDRVEAIFRSPHIASRKVQQSLAVLQNTRQNFEAMSPRFSS